MDDYDDIVLDQYDSFLNEKDAGNTDDDPLATTQNNKKRSNKGDKGDAADDDDVLATKKRTKLKKLDHEVLLASEGLTRLRNETIWLDFKEEDNVMDNLDKLMDYYDSWAHSIYPRLNLTDFASKILKATAHKECKAQLRNWRDEYEYKNGGKTEENSSQDHTAGGLSGLTLEDEDNNRQDSDDKGGSSDSSDDEDSSKRANNDDETRRRDNAWDDLMNDNLDERDSSPTPTSSNEQTRPSGDKEWAAMMDLNFDDDDGDQQPTSTKTRPNNNTDDEAGTDTLGTNSDQDNAPLFLMPPPVSSNDSLATNKMSVDDFFAD